MTTTNTQTQTEAEISATIAAAMECDTRREAAIMLDNASVAASKRGDRRAAQAYTQAALDVL